MKKFIALLLVVALTASASIAGTLAYLQDDDSDVNVMTLGNVYIEQHEYERVVDANGNYETNEIDGVTSYVLKKFSQGKSLAPIVGDPSTGEAGWDTIPVRMSQVNSYGGMDVFAGKVAQDKFVTVENTGKNDAYIRTLIAIECGSTSGELVGTSYHKTWTKNSIGSITVDGNNYYVYEFIYNGGQLSNGSWRHQNGVLPAGDTSYPSLSQVYIKSEAGNDDMKAIDGNGNGTLDILTLSQAVQVSGFEVPATATISDEEVTYGAAYALNTAFGKSSEKAAEWFEGISTDIVEYDHFVSDLDGLKEAIAEGGNIMLNDDIEFEKMTTIEPDVEVYLNLNGNTITVDENTTSNTLLYVKEGGKLIIDGEGTIDLGSVSTMAIFAPYGELVIENGTFIRDEVKTVTNKTTGLFMGCNTTASNVTINGGYFDPGYYDENAADIEALLSGTKTFEETADDIAKRGNSKDANAVRVALKDNISVVLNHSGYGTFKIYGGTFVGANPAWGDEGCMLPTTPNYLRPWSYYQGALLDGQTFHENGIVLPEGYSITRGTTNEGVPTYTVNYSK